jgi:hypothetical protein
MIMSIFCVAQGPESCSLKRKMEEKRSSSQGETAYDLLLKQQQLFLQWQLENQNKVRPSHIQ